MERIFKECKNGDRQHLELRLQNKCDTQIKDVKQNSPLHIAVEAVKNEINIINLLLDYGFDPNALNDQNAAPLHYVSFRKSNASAVVKLMVERGAKIDIQMEGGFTPLHIASEHHNFEVVKTLIELGASAQQVDQHFNTPAHIVLKSKGRDVVANDILTLLLNNGVEIESQNDQGEGLLYLSAKAGYIKCCQTLLEKNASTIQETFQRNLPIHAAAEFGHAEVLEFLLSINQSVINHQNLQADTALHLGAKKNHSDVVINLIRRGADLMLTNKEGKQAWKYATNKNVQDIESMSNPELRKIMQIAKDRILKENSMISQGECNIL